MKGQNKIIHKVEEDYYNPAYSKEEIDKLWEEAEKSKSVRWDDVRDKVMKSN